jgi:malate permease
VILQVLASIIPIVFLIVLGFFLHEKKYLSKGLDKNLTFLVMNIALPASVFLSVVNNLTIKTLEELAKPLIIGMIAFACNYLLSYFLMQVVRVPRGRRGVFLNTIVNANTIFIGMPLNQALFGSQAVSYFLVYYVLNTVSTWTIGSVLIARDGRTEQAGGGKINLKQILSPPILGLLLAIPVLLFGLSLPKPVISSLSYLGSLVTPLSLLYIGIVLSEAGLKSVRFDKDTLVALLGKFILSPALMACALLFAVRFGITVPVLLRNTMIVQAAVPALTVLPILAGDADGDVEYATNVVVTSTVLFVVVIPLVMTLLK